MAVFSVPNGQDVASVSYGNFEHVKDLFNKGLVVAMGILSTTGFNLSSLSSPSPIQPTSPAYNTLDELSCPSNLPFSCSNSTQVDNLCCFEYPGGVVLQTQFWDYNPSTGPNDSFTLHGLWPDNCDGSFEQFCDKSLEINSVESIIANSDPELLNNLHTYWKDYKGNDAYLWEHEYNKHGTCYSTLKPKCYGSSYNSTSRQDVVDYFKISYELYETLPTYDWLKEEGIVPSTTATYDKQQIIDALTKHFGAVPYISCDYHNALNEVWYFHHLKGSLISSNFDKIDTLTTSRCRASGIKFLPKGESKPIPTGTRTTSTLYPKPTSDGTRGFVTLSGQSGCLIRNGKWYTTGSCATYTLIRLSTGSYTLRSSGGYCTLDDDKSLSCSHVNSPYEFEYDTDSNTFSANGVNVWNADAVPSGRNQVEIQLGKGSIEFQLKFKAH